MFLLLQLCGGYYKIKADATKATEKRKKEVQRMAQKKKTFGVTDLPCNTINDDLLNTTTYVEALREAIATCQTPMSIAIQGDWGTGKTSMIHMLQDQLEKGKAQTQCVYFNTWQYSQFDAKGDLYVSFVNALVLKCGIAGQKTKEVLNLIQKIGTQFLYNAFENKTGVDVETLIEKQKERILSVEKLKDKFAELVAATLTASGKDRMVIFIDDLDRLQPETAVGLLEVIKLFMDVEKCVFVLAIDYEVVVNGVRKKYGQNVSDEKCHSFFDKIFQLPFRLPVESYSMDHLVEETIGDEVEAIDIAALTDFVSTLLGYNPRAFKRLANSFFLIEKVREALTGSQGTDNKKLDNTLIYATLCIQMSLPNAYALLLAAESEQELQALCSDATTASLPEKMPDEEKEEILNCMGNFDELLKELVGNRPGDINIYARLKQVLKMAAITSVSAEEPKKRSQPIRVDTVLFQERGEKVKVDTPTEATLKAYQQLLGTDPGLLREFCKQEPHILTTSQEAKTAYFRYKKKLNETGTPVYYLGLSSSTADKIKCMNKLCLFLQAHGIDAPVIWQYKGETVHEFPDKE